MAENKKSFKLAPLGTFEMKPWILKRREEECEPSAVKNPKLCDGICLCGGSNDRKMLDIENNMLKLQDMIIKHSKMMTDLANDISLLVDNMTMLCSKVCRLIYVLNEDRVDSSTPNNSMEIESDESIVFRGINPPDSVPVNGVQNMNILDTIDDIDVKPFSFDDDARDGFDDVMRDWQ